MFDCTIKTMRNPIKTIINYVAIFLIIFGLWSIFSQPKRSKQLEVRMSSDILYSMYQNNQVRADQQFKGKTLEITGTIDTIGKTTHDIPYVTLKTHDDISIVQCLFSKNHENILAALSPGHKVTVTGICDGSKTFGNILLLDCRLSTK